VTHLFDDHVARLLHEERAARYERQARADRLARSTRGYPSRLELELSGLRAPTRPPRVNAPIEISADRLDEFSTGELAWLADQFHELTVQMYDELCLRRRADHCFAEIKAMLEEQDRGSS
jgi:hypothetical protein